MKLLVSFELDDSEEMDEDDLIQSHIKATEDLINDLTNQFNIKITNIKVSPKKD